MTRYTHKQALIIPLTHIPLDKMAAIPQITDSNALSWIIFFSIQIGLNVVPMGPFDNKPALVNVMASHRTGRYLNQCWPYCGLTKHILNWIFILSGDGLCPASYQAITQSNADALPIVHQRANLNRLWILRHKSIKIKCLKNAMRYCYISIVTPGKEIILSKVCPS